MCEIVWISGALWLISNLFAYGVVHVGCASLVIPLDLEGNAFFDYTPVVGEVVFVGFHCLPYIDSDSTKSIMMLEKFGPAAYTGNSWAPKVQENVDRLTWFKKLLRCTLVAISMVMYKVDVGNGFKHNMELIGFRLPALGFDIDASGCFKVEGKFVIGSLVVRRPSCAFRSMK